MQKKNLILFGTLTLLLFSLLACTPAAPAVPTQAAVFPTEERHLDVVRVSLEDAKAAYDSGSAVFVDVRSETAYAEAHIPGALSIPGNVLESQMDELDPGQWIITYCT